MWILRGIRLQRTHSIKDVRGEGGGTEEHQSKSGQRKLHVA